MKFIGIDPHVILQAPYKVMSTRAKLTLFELRMWAAIIENKPRWGVIDVTRLDYLAANINHESVSGLASDIEEIIKSDLAEYIDEHNLYLVGFDEIQEKVTSSRFKVSERVRNHRKSKPEDAKF